MSAGKGERGSLLVRGDLTFLSLAVCPPEYWLSQPREVQLLPSISWVGRFLFMFKYLGPLWQGRCVGIQMEVSCDPAQEKHALSAGLTMWRLEAADA